MDAARERGTDRPHDPLADRLIALQGDRTDEEMAVLVGTSRPNWTRIRRRNRGLTRGILRRAVASFPELWPDVVRDFSTEAAQ